MPCHSYDKRTNGKGGTGGGEGGCAHLNEKKLLNEETYKMVGQRRFRRPCGFAEIVQAFTFWPMDGKDDFEKTLLVSWLLNDAKSDGNLPKPQIILARFAI